MDISLCCLIASPDTTPKFRPPETSCPLSPIELGLVNPPALDKSCLEPHSGQKILSSGIKSLHEPHSMFTPTPNTMARSSLPKVLTNFIVDINNII